MTTANKMSKEEFMAKVTETKNLKEENKMITKTTKGAKETKKVVKKEEVKKVNLEKPVIERIVPEVKVDETLPKSNINLEKAPKEEVKEVAVVKETPVVKNEDNVLEYDKATKIIQNHIHINQDLKIVETANASGTSYFSGRTRLFKLIKSKRGISLEINVQLPKELCKEVTGMEDISVATAHMKHLGTMKHHYRNTDSKELAKIIHAIMATFKTNNTKKEEVKEAKAI